MTKKKERIRNETKKGVSTIRNKSLTNIINFKVFDHPSFPFDRFHRHD